ncbi:mph1 [Symbiodinium natans]|uniref:Mph1 protein n=1 Tax=Symbiodinium natans TaxID=878477 RepID=A0A812K5I6_9DINO|nr:mph1 [Symbiodinium natans]
MLPAPRFLTTACLLASCFIPGSAVNGTSESSCEGEACEVSHDLLAMIQRLRRDDPTYDGLTISIHVSSTVSTNDGSATVWCPYYDTSRKQTPTNAWVLMCMTDPPDSGDGVEYTSNDRGFRGCKAFSSGSSIRAVAVCSNMRTNAVQSGPYSYTNPFTLRIDAGHYFQEGLVEVTCDNGKRPYACLCRTKWGLKYCQGSSLFAPDVHNRKCTRQVPTDIAHRRRRCVVCPGPTDDDSEGAYVFAICIGKNEEVDYRYASTKSGDDAISSKTCSSGEEALLCTSRPQNRGDGITVGQQSGMPNSCRSHSSGSQSLAASALCGPPNSKLRLVTSPSDGTYSREADQWIYGASGYAGGVRGLRCKYRAPGGHRRRRGSVRRQLALKRVTASCPKHFEALANEVTLLQQLKDSHNIIQVLDAEVLPERLLIHIVMEEGQMDLGRLLQAEADMTLGEVQVLWRQMLEAVQVVHRERVVHSDLKPGNFLLVKQSLKLIDFGIAKRIASNTTNISRESSVGTISYMAPEAVKQGAVKMGRPSDVWSLGIILYQMVYMKAPFAHLDPMQRLFALTDPGMAVEFPQGHRFESHSQEAKDSLLDVLQRCLQREPSKRPTIPELLEHPFLVSETIQLSRANFDRTMEALVRSFMGAAQEAIESAGGPSSANAAEGPPVCWQILADEAWKRISDGNAGWQAKDQTRVDFPGLAPFREWLARGFKRQKVAEAPKVPAPAAAPNAKGAVAAAAPPPAPVPSSRPGPGTKPPQKPGERRVPLHQAAPPNAKGDGGRPPIHAELLQKQRTNLRKAAGTGVTVGKENVAPPSKDTKTAGFAAENLVLKRLKNRRALLADEKAEDDQTDTDWGH